MAAEASDGSLGLIRLVGARLGLPRSPHEGAYMLLSGGVCVVACSLRWRLATWAMQWWGPRHRIRGTSLVQGSAGAAPGRDVLSSRSERRTEGERGGNEAGQNG